MKTIPAIFENGVFRPELPVHLPAGLHVEVIVPEKPHATREALRKRFPNSYGVLSAREAHEIQHAIDEEFGRVDPNDWR